MQLQDAQADASAKVVAAALEVLQGKAGIEALRRPIADMLKANGRGKDARALLEAVPPASLAAPHVTHIVTPAFPPMQPGSLAPVGDGREPMVLTDDERRLVEARRACQRIGAWNKGGHYHQVELDMIDLADSRARFDTRDLTPAEDAAHPNSDVKG